MLDIYARSFLEATRVDTTERQDPATKKRLAKEAAQEAILDRIWRRRPYWL
ncbi:hypothetical protein [uncultured Roseibium sp.]|uniref:hypothetical protein n=1 Tax=uncultured Roseibium sp. TaxID=1936171 RepID=UPI00261C2701|nr:hypothetical protein [uncultured Roseibium sp.]